MPYYIAELTSAEISGISRKVDTFAQFMRSKPPEGSTWAVRKKRKIDRFDFMAIYDVTDGKFVKRKNESVGLFL